MCASFTKPLKMSSIPGQTLTASLFFFFKDAVLPVKMGKLSHVKKKNNKNNQNLLCSRCEVSVVQGRRDTASFFSRFLFFSLNACGLSDTVLQRQNPGHFFTLPQNFLLTLYVSSFTLLRKTKVLKLACWKTSSKAASF